jgi:hypothetical protein
LGQLVHLFFLLPEEWGPGLRVGSGDVLPRKRAAPRTGSTPSYRMKKKAKEREKSKEGAGVQSPARPPFSGSFVFFRSV